MSEMREKIAKLPRPQLDHFEEDAVTWLFKLEEDFKTFDDFAKNFFDNHESAINSSKYFGERLCDWEAFFEFLTGEEATGNEDPRAIINAAYERGVNPSESAIAYIKQVAEEGY